MASTRSSRGPAVADALLSLLIRITLGLVIVYALEGLYRTFKEFIYGGRR